MYNIRLKPGDPYDPRERAFSAIFSAGIISFNCCDDNPYTLQDIIDRLDLTAKVSYVNAPLESYLTVFKPLLDKMVNSAFPYYQKLLCKDDLMSTLFYTIVKLYNKNYYLHNRLIYKSFINELNMEIRQQKHFTDMQSLDATTESSDETLTLLDTLIDPDEYNLYHYAQDQELFQKVKTRMLKDMSPLAFERILIQLKSKTIDPRTSLLLKKYREEFNNETI